MIEFKNISKSYNGQDYAVRNVSFTVENGEIFGFLGPNGAGKTTTIKMLTGILDIDFGEILINGHDIKKDGVAAKKEFGYVPDSPDLFLKFTGIDYLRFLANIYKVDPKVREERIALYAEKFGLTYDLKSKIRTYSHGMRQKIVIIGALIHEPSVLILDEPLTGLDPKSAFILKEIMHEHTRKGNSVFFSSHVLDVVEKLCDRIGIIRRGELIYCGAIEDLKKEDKNDSLEEIFLELVDHV